MNKRHSIILISLIISIMMLGCTNNGNEKRPGDDSDLTDRQVSILKDNFSTTVYEDLSDEDKEKIISIEEIMQEMDKRYGEEFTYRHYIKDNENNTETLIVKLEKDDIDFNNIIITRTKDEDGNYKYTDTYITETLEINIDKYISNLMESRSGLKKFLVKSTILETTLEKIPKDYKGMDNQINGHYLIFLDSKEVSKDKVADINKLMSDWLTEHKIKGFVNLIVLKEGNFDKLDDSNYSQYLASEYVELRDSVYVDVENETDKNDTVPTDNVEE